MKRVFFVLLLVTITSCASFSENFVKQGELSLYGGRYENQRWSDNLKFERVSWFQELTLLFDFLYYPLTEDSPFYVWLGESERASLSGCHSSYIILTYALDSRKISRPDFYQKLAAQGHQVISVPTFRSHLRNHPDIEKLSLGLYDINGLCLEENDISVSFPGFRVVTI